MDANGLEQFQKVLPRTKSLSHLPTIMCQMATTMVKKRTNYVRDSSYWTQETGKTKCPLNYEPDSDYWSYLSSSECSYNHKGSPGFEDLKVSGESESE